ncbi:MAG: hypothetical protein GXO12_02465 [Epsilonproteobacteria bacterium]|nr:hypothetical protein [Campylobacterota bacterium]
MIKVAINGFGRIGRCLTKAILQENLFKIVLINDIYDSETMEYLFRHDSVYGDTKYDLKDIKITNTKDIQDLNLQDIDIVFECSGVYSTEKELSKHIKNGAKRVILTSHSKDVRNFISGVNEHLYKKEKIVAASSCTANSIAPVLKILENENIKIKSFNATTLHSYTSEQNLLDNKNSDIRRCRASALNIIPLASNVQNSVAYFFPHLKDKIRSKSVRVPVENGILIDLHIKLSKKSDLKAVKDALSKSDKTLIKLSFCDIVSRYVRNDTHSTIIDIKLIQLIKNDFLRLLLWQDNEYGYANRVLDFAKIVGKSL